MGMGNNYKAATLGQATDFAANANPQVPARKSFGDFVAVLGGLGNHVTGVTEGIENNSILSGDPPNLEI